ncbi:MAG TPA: hypothetical protein VGM62_14815 [Chthoniobacterales bacterium]|jgi:hypothetical protein
MRNTILDHVDHMIRLRVFWKICKVAAVLCAYCALTAAGGKPRDVNEVVIDNSRQVLFSTRAEWYNPEPDDLKPPQHWSEIPREVIAAVMPDKHTEAAAWLGENDVISLSDTQTRSLGCPVHPDETLKGLIKDREGRVTLLESSYLNDKNARILLRNLKQEVADYTAWRGQLRPYLIKAVSLNPQGLGFHAKFADKTLFLDQITPIGDTPVPMINMPVVAFLPVKPDKIYTSFTTVR